MKNKILLVALAATTQINASEPLGGKVTTNYSPTGNTFNVPGQSPASMSASGGNTFDKKTTSPDQKQTLPTPPTASIPTPVMPGSSSAPTSGMTPANQIVTANVPSAAMPGSDPKTWAPMTVNDDSGKALGTARMEQGSIRSGMYQPTGQDAQPAFFVLQNDPANLIQYLNTNNLLKIGSAQRKDDTFDVYIVNPNPVTSDSDDFNFSDDDSNSGDSDSDDSDSANSDSDDSNTQTTP
ncbi:hypothetical protein EBR77_02780 [bacterium]|nr:hypothetical protein [bacterium]NBX78330.1 hypothetical protein [bacterium]